MFGKTSSLIVLYVLIFVGCAQPKYAEESAANTNQIKQDEKKTECSIAFAESKYCLVWYWEALPTAQHAGSLIFKVFRLNVWDQTPIEVDTAQIPEVVLWMPSMGHGSTPTQTQRLDVGTYQTRNVFFIMPGSWEIRFIVKENEKPNSKQMDGVVVDITI